MAIDIQSGDFLVIGSTEYPIRKANIWDVTVMVSRFSFRPLATVACSTKRSPAADADGFIGTPATNLSGLYCVPLAPVSNDLAVSEGLDTVYDLRQTMVADADSFAHLFLEDVKRT